MKANPLLIAAAVLVLLGAAVWYTRENPPPDSDGAPEIVDVEEDELRKIVLRREGEQDLAMVREEGGEWEFSDGAQIAADDTAVGLMASSLASLNADRLVSETVSDWEPYGLESPALAVGFELAEGGGEIQFGSDTPTGSGVFARLKDDPRLFTVYSYNKTSFEKSEFDLRDKRLIRLDEDSISSVTVTAGGRTTKFEQQDGDWSITEPSRLRADDFTVDDLVRSVRTAEMTEVLAEGAAAAEFAFGPPKATVEIEDSGGQHELVIGQQGETHFGRSSSQEGVYAISATLAESFDKPVSDFRNKKLFDFGYADPARLDVRAGEKAAAVVRSDGSWLLESDGSRELDGSKVQTLLDRLRGLTATEFPSDRQEEQASFGLDEPFIEASVTPEAENAVPEKVLVASADAAAAYAARDGEPSTYQVEQSAVDDIVRALEEVLAETDDETEDAADEDSPDSDGDE